MVKSGSVAEGETAVIRILGPLEIGSGSHVIRLTSARQRTLLLRLLVAGGRTSTGALVSALWGALPPPSAWSTIKTHASHLRAALAGVGVELVGHRGGYELVLDRDQVDAYRFEQLCRHVDERHAAATIDRLTTALALWRGPALLEVRDEPFAMGAATRLDELRLQAIERRADAWLELDCHDDVIAELTSVVHDHPLRERLHGRLMLALYRAGRQSEALDVYATLRTTLRTELGVDPSGELHELQRTVLRHGSKPPSGPSHPTIRKTLPCPLDELIGRTAVVSRALDLLDTHRLVVLTGPGGIGKTRVAIAAGHRARRPVRRRAGDEIDAVFADLSVVRQASAVASTIVTAITGLGPDGVGEDVDAVCAWVGSRRLLLVVDNCEHLLEPTAHVIERILQRCEGVRVLATSREPLAVLGEVVYEVPPLLTRCDDDEADIGPAVRLFLERARAVRSAFTLGPADRQRAEEICDAVDGIPLAIELAAARMSHLSLAQVADRLGDHEGFLATSTRRPERHRALAATIAWSVDLLDPSERTLFLRLSIFAGEFSLDAVEAVCADGPGQRVDLVDMLGALVRKSLVVAVDRGDEVRYRLLVTLRRFATERLADADAVLRRERHARYYLDSVEGAAPSLNGPDEAATLDRLQHQLDDIRAAVRWLIDHDRRDDALRMAGALRRFWRARGYITEGRRWLRQALEPAVMGVAQPTADRARALQAAGWLAHEQGDYDEAHRSFDEGLTIYRELGDDEGCGWALVGLGFVARYKADYAAARTLLSEGSAVFEGTNDLEGSAAALGNLGLVARDRGEFRTAEDLLERSLTLFRTVGDQVGSGWVLTALGMVARTEQRSKQAEHRLEEALSVWQELDDRPNMGNVLSILAALACDRGELDRASQLLAESLTLQRDVGNRRGVAFSLEGCAQLARRRGDAAAAVTLVAAAGSLRREISAPAPPQWQSEITAVIDASTAVLDPATVAAATATGAEMDVNTAVAMAMATGRTPEPPLA